MLVVGLTGSIGMGKSTVAAMLRARGIPVHDADAAVHRLYRGEAVEPLEAAFPGVAAGGEVDRRRLAEYVVGDAEALARLEAIVHPMVRHSADAFLAESRAGGRAMVVLEVPLLFETGRDRDVDAVVVVSAAPEIQRQRVLARPGMDEAKLEALLARQITDAEKRRRAHWIIDSGRGMAAAERQVAAVLRALTQAA